MDTQPKGRELTEEEEKEYNTGMDLLTITKMPGWKAMYELWNAVAQSVGPDPRGMDKDDYTFACLASWAAANNAKEFLQTVQEMIDRAEALDNVRTGKTKNRNMKI